MNVRKTGLVRKTGFVELIPIAATAAAAQAPAPANQPPTEEPVIQFPNRWTYYNLLAEFIKFGGYSYGRPTDL